MNYKDTLIHFRKAGVSNQERFDYVNDLQLQKNSKMQFLEPEKFKKTFKVDDNTFILIDGPSCSGKSTLARKLAKIYDAIVFDIDIILLNYVKQLIAENPVKAFLPMSYFDKITDEYIENNLERLIQDGRKYKKPVILVGYYVNVLARAIIVKTLTKNFSRIVSFICFERDEKRFIRAVNSREKIDSCEIQNINDSHYVDSFNQYNVVLELLIKKCSGFGVGMDECYVLGFDEIEKI